MDTEKTPGNGTIDETFETLDGLISDLEDGEGSLEDAFREYEEGMKLIRDLNEKIEKIEKQVQILGGDQMEDEEDDR